MTVTAHGIPAAIHVSLN